MEQFNEVFKDLRNILARHSKNMDVKHDTGKDYYVDTKKVFRGKPVFFAAVKIMKNYVSFHLMPIYMNPALQKKISPELKKHMQGKACFNFKKPDEKLYKELDSLTAEGKKVFSEMDFSKLTR